MNSSSLRPWLAAIAASATAPLAAQVQNEAAAVQNDTHPLLWLALLTLAIVIGVAIWQRRKVSQAKRTHEHSSLGKGHGYVDRQRGNDPR